MNISPQKITSHAYFSPGDGCLDAIIDSIEKAEFSLKICVFTISDNRITDAILRAHKRGVEIKILTDNDKLHDKGSDIKELAYAGITIRIDATRNHMHHKFAIFDNTAILTGSYNWTRSAALYNHENVLTTDNQTIVLDYCREFDKLWDKMVPYHVKEKDRFYPDDEY